MELWIRSQSKRNLMKAEDIVADKNEIKIFKQNDDSTIIAEYKTEERALEVLNEIQDYLIRQGQLFITTNERGIPNGSKYYSNVYEMPKE